MRKYAVGEVVIKPWGYEKWISCNEHYVVRELLIKKDHAVSLQYHEKKIETLYVLEGRAIYTLQRPGEDKTERIIGAGEILNQFPYEIHRQRALEDFRFIEVSTPELEDIVRLEDDYGRGSYTL